MNTPTLIEQVYAGNNGTRIYEMDGRYYAIDGEFDCRLDGRELAEEAWGSFKTLESARRATAKGDDRIDTESAAAVLGQMGGRAKTDSKSAASRTNGKLGGRMSDKTEINLENLWSGSVSTMTWGEIKSWCETNVYPNDRKDWIKQAREATRNSDSKLLGKMIIGS